MENREIVLYTTEDGTASIQLRTQDSTVWLTSQNTTTHLRAIYADNKLNKAATCKESLQVQSEGKRTIRGKFCYGKTLMRTFVKSKQLTHDKIDFFRN